MQEGGTVSGKVLSRMRRQGRMNRDMRKNDSFFGGVSVKKNLLRISNILLYLLFCALAETGLLLEYKTPLDEGENTQLFGVPGEDWGEIHLWLGIAVVTLVVFHLALNWKGMSKIVLGGRLWSSVTTIAVGVIMIVGLLFAPIQGGRVTNGEEKHHAAAEHEVEDD